MRATKPKSSFPHSPTKIAIKRPFSHVLLAMGAYVLVGSILTFYNKGVLSSWGFRFEVTMILVHSLFNTCFAALYCYTCLRDQSDVTACKYWPANITLTVFLSQLFPLGALFGFDITLTNLSFRLSSVALTEVVKSGIPALVLFFGIVAHQETISRRKLIVVAVLCFGIVMTTIGDFTLKLSALIAASAATFCGAAKLVLTQRLLAGKERLHPTLSLMYLASSATLALLAPFFIFEASHLADSPWVSRGQAPYTMLMLAFGALFAFLLNMIELIIIQWSSALNLCVAGVVKLLTTIVISATWLDFKPTTTNVCGSILSVVAVIAFNWITYEDRRLALQYAKLDSELEELTNMDLSPHPND